MLSAIAQNCLADEAGEGPAQNTGVRDGAPVTAVALLRGERPEAQTLLTALAAAWVRGARVDWPDVFDGAGAKRVPLPTYAFQRERYWLQDLAAGHMAAAGQSSADHPLLGAMVGLADGESRLFTGRLSLATHPWLADHNVLGVVVVPGTTFVELSLHAGARVACDRVDELIIESPLVLGEQDGVQLQVSVGMPDESGRRTVGIYARVESPSDDAMYPGQMWVRHASGVLARAQATSEDRPVVDGRAAALADVSWPPEGSEAVPADDLYDRLAGLGLDYGPAFLGIRAVWRRGREVFLELSLSGREQAQASQFGLHPALLDAGLQGIAASLTNGSADVGEAIALRLPFSFSGVELHARGASALRVHLLPVGADGMSLVGADESGTLVVSMQSLTLREVPAGVLAGVGGADHDSLFCVNWVPIAVSVAPPISAGGWVLLDAGEQGGESPDAGLGTERGGLVEATATFAGTDSATTALAPASTASSTRRTLVDTPLVEALRVAGVLDGALVCADLLALGEAVDNGARVPEIVLVDLSADLGDAGLPEVAHEAVNHALGLVQSWLSDERFSTSRLVFVTRGAVAVQTGEQLPGLALAPVWGLVRSAQSENPDRLLLIDLDAHEASPRTLLAVLAATGMDEPQLAIRQGEVLAARLGRIAQCRPPPQ